MGEPGSSSGGACGAESGSGNEGAPDPAVVASMTADELKKFIDTGRSGRRNALPDVTQPEAATQSSSTTGVTEALESLSVQSGPSSSTENKEGDS